MTRISVAINMEQCFQFDEFMYFSQTWEILTESRYNILDFQFEIRSWVFQTRSCNQTGSRTNLISHGDVCVYSDVNTDRMTGRLSGHQTGVFYWPGPLTVSYSTQLYMRIVEFCRSYPILFFCSDPSEIVASFWNSVETLLSSHRICGSAQLLLRISCR